jgi:transposase
MGKHISKSIKEEAIKLVEENGVKTTKVSKELGISSATLHRWLKEYRNVSSNGLNLEEKSELKTLRAKVRILELEKDLLKKATVYFAKHSE